MLNLLVLREIDIEELEGQSLTLAPMRLTPEIVRYVAMPSFTLEYLFQDVRIGTPESMHGSLDRKIVRGIAEKTENYSSRSVAFRLTQAAASTITGISGFVGNDLLISAASLLGGPAKEGPISSLPDLTASEIARVDDLGFTTLSTVVPKNSSIPIVTFLLFRPYFYLNEYKKLEKPDKKIKIKKDQQTSETTAENFHGSTIEISSKNKDKLNKFWNSLEVEIAGIHVTQADINRPTFKAIVSPIPAVLSTKLSSPAVFIISGSGFTSVASASLRFSGDTGTRPAVPVLFQPLSGQTSLDDTIAQIVVPEGTSLAQGTWTVVLTTKDSYTSDTGKQLTVNPVPAADIISRPVQSNGKATTTAVVLGAQGAEVKPVVQDGPSAVNSSTAYIPYRAAEQTLNMKNCCCSGALAVQRVKLLSEIAYIEVC